MFVGLCEEHNSSSYNTLVSHALLIYKNFKTFLAETPNDTKENEINNVHKVILACIPSSLCAHGVRCIIRLLYFIVSDLIMYSCLCRKKAPRRKLSPQNLKVYPKTKVMMIYRR